MPIDAAVLIADTAIVAFAAAAAAALSPGPAAIIHIILRSHNMEDSLVIWVLFLRL